MIVHVMAEGAVASRRPVPMHPKAVRCCWGMSGWGHGRSTTISELASGKSSDHWAWKSSALGMVLEDSTEVMRGSTYEQVGEDRKSKETDRCPLTVLWETRAITQNNMYYICSSQNPPRGLRCKMSRRNRGTTTANTVHSQYSNRDQHARTGPWWHLHKQLLMRWNSPALTMMMSWWCHNQLLYSREPTIAGLLRCRSCYKTGDGGRPILAWPVAWWPTGCGCGLTMGMGMGMLKCTGRLPVQWYAIGTLSTYRPMQAEGFQCISVKLCKSWWLPAYKKLTTLHTYKLVDFLLSILTHQSLTMPSVLSLSCLFPSLPLFSMLHTYLWSSLRSVDP
jgi:hypothetical protein